MNTPMKWNTSGSREVMTVARPRWRQVRQGFVLAALGYVLLFALGLPGLLLAGGRGESIASLLRLESEDAIGLGYHVMGLAALLSFLLVLAGQWVCLIHAPQGNGAKEMLFACLLCFLMAPPFLIAAHFFGGSATYAALAQGPAGLRSLNLLNGGCVLQLVGLLLGLLSGLLFSGFARAVAGCLKEAGHVRQVSSYFWFVAFLLGGTAGMFLNARHLPWQDVWVVLALGWLVCQVWQALLIYGSARCIGRVLARERSGVRPAVPASGEGKGQVVLQVASYFGGRR